MEAAITIISFARRTIVSVSVRVGTDIKILAIGCHVVMPSGLVDLWTRFWFFNGPRNYKVGSEWACFWFSKYS